MGSFFSHVPLCMRDLPTNHVWWHRRSVTVLTHHHNGWSVRPIAYSETLLNTVKHLGPSGKPTKNYRKSPFIVRFPSTNVNFPSFFAGFAGLRCWKCRVAFGQPELGRPQAVARPWLPLPVQVLSQARALQDGIESAAELDITGGCTRPGKLIPEKKLWRSHHL